MAIVLLWVMPISAQAPAKANPVPVRASKPVQSQTHPTPVPNIGLSQVDAQALVRKAAANAAAGAQDTNKLFMYRVMKETSSGVALRDMVETKDVILARTLTWNGRQLTPGERAKEDERLDLVVTDPEELSKKRSDQDADRNRTLQLVRALPDALRYTYDGSQLIQGREAIRLKFTPNPDFSPTSKETYGLKAAAGTLWIDKEQTQIIRMEAELTENVYIGWGILGHINKGGRLELEQSLLPGNAWRISKLNIEATGKAFFFKTIRIKQRQSGWDYKPVPNSLTVAQAVATLKQTAAISAQRAATP
ncbi:MAG TPA: hypothetical protein VM009_02280 [Terriglobales bacterium]|nr:hypothetical protein [Terriglobales bacterium]